MLILLKPLNSVPQCDHYGLCRNHYPFLPAAPGSVPPCAKPGSTFCEKIDQYPTNLIRYLIEKWGYEYSTLLSDESRDGFNYRSPPTYGPSHHPGYTYGPPKVHGYPFYPGVRLTGNASSGGYPDRQYKLPPQFLTPGPYLYTTLIQPVTHYNPDEWWERYARSNAEGTVGSNQHHKLRARKKRQAGGASQLCPTRTEYIMPKAAMNNRGNWMYVVNLNEVDDRYTQLVGTETCTQTQCNGLCTIPNGYTARCQQQYVQKRLAALDGRGDRLYTDIFWFPHCSFGSYEHMAFPKHRALVAILGNTTPLCRFIFCTQLLSAFSLWRKERMTHLAVTDGVFLRYKKGREKGSTLTQSSVASCARTNANCSTELSATRSESVGTGGGGGGGYQQQPPSQPPTPSSTVQDTGLPPFSSFSGRLLDISSWDYYEGLTGRLLDRGDGLPMLIPQPQYRPWESKGPDDSFSSSANKLPSFQSQFNAFPQEQTVTGNNGEVLTTLTAASPSPSSSSSGLPSFHTLSAVNPRPGYPLVPAPVQAREIPAIQQQFLDERHIQLFAHSQPFGSAHSLNNQPTVTTLTTVLTQLTQLHHSNFQNPMGVLDVNKMGGDGLKFSDSPLRGTDSRKKERRKVRASSLESSTESDGAGSSSVESSGQVAAVSSTAGFKSPLQPSSNTPSVSDSEGEKPVKKKRKRCGECTGCQRKDNCGDCAPCRNDKSHQICKMRRCEKLTEKKIKC
ncbi:hypothetical protein L9F63_003709, partial [Diploptera punctata]